MIIIIQRTKSRLEINWKDDTNKQYLILIRYDKSKITYDVCLFKKLLFTMENATTAGSSQSNISRLYI